MYAQPLFRKIDCLSLRVASLDDALRFYRDTLGHELIWRDATATAAGLRMPDCDAELVLHTNERPPEADLMVDSVPEAIRRFCSAGGQLLHGPFPIRIGLCAVVRDPWGNELVMLDASSGMLTVDGERNVVRR
jgi:lactoylglutathione lyase